jgi:very-short-patch-repair endonuclease
MNPPRRIYNKNKTLKFRRSLRANLTDAEVILWSKLKRKQIGYKFRRQYSFDSFIVDFYSPELRLVIEVDGDSHYLDGAAERDKKRQMHIELCNVEVIRFTNTNIYYNLDGVIERIVEVAEKQLSKRNPS